MLLLSIAIKNDRLCVVVSEDEGGDAIGGLVPVDDRISWGEVRSDSIVCETVSNFLFVVEEPSKCAVFVEFGLGEGKAWLIFADEEIDFSEAEDAEFGFKGSFILGFGAEGFVEGAALGLVVAGGGEIVLGEGETNDLLEGEETLFREVGFGEERKGGLVGLECFGESFGFEINISQFALEEAVTERMRLRRAIGQTDGEACDLTLVAALVKFWMRVVKIGGTLIENDG